MDVKRELRATSDNNASSTTVPALRSNSFFTPRNVVNCVDLLLNNPNRKSLRIVFIGDSVVRNQFLNFIKVSIYVCSMLFYTIVTRLIV